MLITNRTCRNLQMNNKVLKYSVKYEHKSLRHSLIVNSPTFSEFPNFPDQFQITLTLKKNLFFPDFSLTVGTLLGFFGSFYSRYWEIFPIENSIFFPIPEEKIPIESYKIKK